MAISQVAQAQDSEQQRSLEEVVVTAQRREERLQEVPISISVIGGNALDKSTVQGVTEALNQVAGVATTVGYQGGGTQVAVRGVTAGGALFNGSSPIAYYLDAVPFGFVKTAIAPDSNAYDLRQIEVLRGPQGTLYGASAQNGVVRVLTRDADLNEFQLKARTSGSSTSDGGQNYRGDMAINLPVVKEKLAARLVAGYESLSGWIDKPGQDDVNDGELANVRLKVNAQPTEQLSIGLTSWFSRSDYDAPSVSTDDGLQTTLVDQPIEIDYDVYGLKVAYEFANFTLSSVTSYLDYSNGSTFDLVRLFTIQSPLFTGLDSKVFAQEIGLSSSDEGAWRWSLGAMYRDAEDRLLQTLPGLLPAPIDFGDASESVAIYGELTRVLLDGQLELTVGLRHFEDDVTQFENVRHTGSTTEPLFRSKRTFDADSPRLVLTWLPSDRLTVYTSYAEGFRSGFSQNANVIASAPQFPPLEADTLKNYEIGVKGAIAGGALAYDAAAYYMDWQDVQQTLTVTANGVPVTALVNGESASGAGFDFALMAQPVEALHLGVTFSWNDLSMDSDVFSGGTLLFAKGDRLNLSPEYTVGATADYSFDLGRSGLTGRFATSGNYTSEQDSRTILGAQLISRGDPILVGRASFSVESAAWGATLFVDNFNDERGTPAAGAFAIEEWSSRLRPRTFGLQLEYRFE